MSKPVVAIVGRPNVGKSTLFNALAGEKISIVKDTPGVTRDRIYADVSWLDKDFTLIDTGGIEPESKDIILSQMREQAQIAIDTSDVIIFITDVKQGLVDSDSKVADMLRRSGKPVILVVNKVDNFDKYMADTYEFYNLGIGDPVPISASSRLGLGDMLDKVIEHFPEHAGEEEEDSRPRVAIVGKPNVGKSSIINKLLGEQRVIVSDIAGTTRDAIDTEIVHNGYGYEKIDSGAINQGPSAAHWFGTDDLGRDLFARVWQAGRVSLLIGITGALVASLIGSIYGGIAAYFGGIVDDIMMRIVEVLLSIPYLLIVILISVMTDSKSLGTMLIALTLTGWCGIARLVRGQMLQLKSQEFVLAANALGVSPMKIIMKHMIPNTLGMIIVAITFDIPGYIFSEAFLSYVGLGIQPPQTSWGALASAAQQNFMFYPTQLLFPAIMIALTMLSFTLLGDGLRDALDPKLRK